MPIRTIRRKAFLQNYEGDPLALIPLMPEVKRKGYTSVMLAADIDDLVTKSGSGLHNTH